jgi:hypothetical protein
MALEGHRGLLYHNTAEKIKRDSLIVSLQQGWATPNNKYCKYFLQAVSGYAGLYCLIQVLASSP